MFTDDSTLSYCTVAKRSVEFNDPISALEDPPRSNRLPTAMINERIRAVRDRDRQISV